MLIVHLCAIVGLGVVIPLALRADPRAWLAASVAAAASFGLDEGVSAGAMAVPALAMAVATTVRSVLTPGPLFFWSRVDVVRALASAYAVVSAVWFLASRAGVSPLGIEEPIVELTSVHFAYAGVAGLMLACTFGHQWATLLTAVAPPVVAVGFLTETALPQVGGALLMTAGVYLTAWAESRAARSPSIDRRARVLLWTSASSVVIPMVLAVAWAAGQHWGTPALSIPDMARTHGVANAVGFVLCGLLGVRLMHRSEVRA